MKFMSRVALQFCFMPLLLLIFLASSSLPASDNSSYILFQSPEDSTVYQLQLHPEVRNTREKNIRLDPGDRIRLSLNPCEEGELEDQVIRFDIGRDPQNLEFSLRTPVSCVVKPYMSYSIFVKKGDREEVKIGDIENVSPRPQLAFTLHSNNNPEVTFILNGTKQDLRERNFTTLQELEFRFEKDTRPRIGKFVAIDQNSGVIAPSGPQSPPDLGEGGLNQDPLNVDTPPDEEEDGNTELLSDKTQGGIEREPQSFGASQETGATSCNLTRLNPRSGKSSLWMVFTGWMAIFLILRKKLTY